MPKVVMTHKVVEIERWLKGKDERAAAFAADATDVTDYVATDGSNEIAITADIHDMDGAQAKLASPGRRGRRWRATASCSRSRSTSRGSPCVGSRAAPSTKDVNPGAVVPLATR